jgi:flagellar biosynthetic protein FliR
MASPAQFVGDLLLQTATLQFYAFTLVLVRMSGLMIIGPALGTSAVPINIRIFLVLVLSMLITPTLNNHSQTMFQRLDQNGDHLLSRDEIPDSMRDRFDRRAAELQRSNTATLSEAEFKTELKLPATLVNYLLVIIGELSLGFVLGLGVRTVLSGLQLAGQMIDQQAGLALAEVFNPGFNTNTSISGTFLFMFGVTVFLLMEPVGGHLMMVSAIIETFQTIPIGEAFISVTVVELLRDLVHQSLVLAIQVAAPLLAGMSLVALAMGFLGHTVPQINVLIIGFPIRAVTNLLILSLTLSGAARVVVDVIPKVIDHLRSVLV